MNKQQIILKTADFVKDKFSGESTGHDWWHMYRVWQLAKTIAKDEPTADVFVVEIAALLHDIADWKFHDGDEEAGPKAARQWLEQQKVDEAIIVNIEDIIRTVSFKGAGVKNNMKTIEGKIIHDADKIDAVGAIGIARAFAYGGANHRPIYDPEQKPTMHTDFEAYKNGVSHTINHFYEKLLLLKDRMYTKKGKAIAQQRHDFMEQYLAQFYNEWDGQR
ncbi:HD domain-containing protein [Candidatus Saccharibacteria bacterium]|nr:HD domain-containing protein [Candidatus Saccharibacteria bacterium]